MCVIELCACALAWCVRVIAFVCVIAFVNGHVVNVMMMMAKMMMIMMMMMMMVVHNINDDAIVTTIMVKL